ncbi:uncharacterized protein [Dermacentor andersoni]|uniref:uncharacterized protein isoform X2 n=1 Tax=Dermacentor andersoni TaxID=34620 RepID=UPI0021552D0C|nr:THAP domain-containing protein 2-like isoform X2 [Dermacentor andersoni]
MQHISNGATLAPLARHLAKLSRDCPVLALALQGEMVGEKEQTKPRKKSRNNCCVVGCSNTYENSSETTFYSFPGRPHERERREQWIAAVRRRNADGSPWRPTKHSHVCSDHFVNGRKSNHPRNPAYLPTIFPSVYRSTKKVTDKRLQPRLQLGESGPVPLTFRCELSATSGEVEIPRNSAIVPRRKGEALEPRGAGFEVRTLHVFR